MTINPATTAQSDQVTNNSKQFQVFEFRRYTIKQGEREHFARYFDSYFPEAFQQLGAIAIGQFFERNNPVGFTWIRGFHDMDARAVANSAFYYGPVWKEHKATLNSLMTDSDNVLLLEPLTRERGVLLLPAVDPIREPGGAQGVVVAQIFAVKTDKVSTFAVQAEATFSAYRDAGAREAGVLISLDVKNNFPQLPVRTDGPYLVWLGIVEEGDAFTARFLPLAERSSKLLFASGLLRAKPETVILEPTQRSRLRWLPEWK
jgi:NIPSNAP